MWECVKYWLIWVSPVVSGLLVCSKVDQPLSCFTSAAYGIRKLPVNPFHIAYAELAT